MHKNLTGVFFLLLAGGILGCGNEYGTPVAVTGKVTMGGQAVEKARIIFRADDKKLPAELRTVVGELKPDGTYSFDKIYPAEYMVMLESTEVIDATKSAEPPKSPLTDFGPQSKLRAKVAVDKTKFDFDLTAGSAGK